MKINLKENDIINIIENTIKENNYNIKSYDIMYKILYIYNEFYNNIDLISFINNKISIYNSIENINNDFNINIENIEHNILYNDFNNNILILDNEFNNNYIVFI